MRQQAPASEFFSRDAQNLERAVHQLRQQFQKLRKCQRLVLPDVIGESFTRIIFGHAHNSLHYISTINMAHRRAVAFGYQYWPAILNTEEVPIHSIVMIAL